MEEKSLDHFLAQTYKPTKLDISRWDTTTVGSSEIAESLDRIIQKHGKIAKLPSQKELQLKDMKTTGL